MSDDWKKKREETQGGDIEVPKLLRHPLRPPNEPDVVGETSTPISGSAIEEHSDHAAPEERADQPGLYFYGVVRARGWRGFDRRRREVQYVRYRDIEALVKPTAFELPADRDASVKAHQQVIEGVMRRTTVLPAPFGVVFKGRRPLIRLLQDQYLVLDEGLALLDGHWELRLHVSAGPGVLANPDDSAELQDTAANIYTELRRFARAAVPFASESDRLISAAFLVDRTAWVEFIERIEDFGDHHKELSFDVTGPWPAYDFVRLVT